CSFFSRSRTPGGKARMLSRVFMRDSPCHLVVCDLDLVRPVYLGVRRGARLPRAVPGKRGKNVRQADVARTVAQRAGFAGLPSVRPLTRGPCRMSAGGVLLLGACRKAIKRRPA